MGWASGSSMLNEMWADLRKIVPKEKWREAVAVLFTHFANNDCDTLSECEKAIKDAGAKWSEKAEAFICKDTGEPFMEGILW